MPMHCPLILRPEICFIYEVSFNTSLKKGLGHGLVQDILYEILVFREFVQPSWNSCHQFHNFSLRNTVICAIIKACSKSIPSMDKYNATLKQLLDTLSENNGSADWNMYKTKRRKVCVKICFDEPLDQMEMDNDLKTDVELFWTKVLVVI